MIPRLLVILLSISQVKKLSVRVKTVISQTNYFIVTSNNCTLSSAEIGFWETAQWWNLIPVFWVTTITSRNVDWIRRASRRRRSACVPVCRQEISEKNHSNSHLRLLRETKKHAWKELPTVDQKCCLGKWRSKLFHWGEYTNVLQIFRLV